MSSLSSIESLPITAAPEHVGSTNLVDQERHSLIRAIVRIVESHYDHGAETVAIVHVPVFSSAEECGEHTSDFSVEELRRLHKLMTGQR